MPEQISVGQSGGRAALGGKGEKGKEKVFPAVSGSNINIIDCVSAWRAKRLDKTEVSGRKNGPGET